MENPYNEEFFDARLAGSLESARQIVPFIMELTKCQSVIDVGCGLGTWLAAFSERGVKDLRGIDGDYVNKERLLIPPQFFVTADLRRPQKADRRFDLAVSLEVAEHLPPAGSQDFVDLLTGFSPVVLFSASVPYQDGTDHINEHWLEYWVELFKNRGYAPADCIRPRFWNDRKVDWWYAQNTVLYVSEKHVADYPRIEALLKILPPPLSWVHPQLLIHKENRLQQVPSLKAVWKTALKRSWNKLVSHPDG